AEGAFIGVKYRQGLSILPSSGGTVRVDSKPAGAQVKIDGQPKGATPLSVQVSAGTHVMELSVGGEPRVIPITVNSGEALGQYVELAGAPATGRLGVSSSPAGAAILIDGQPRGVSPAELSDLGRADATGLAVDQDRGACGRRGDAETARGGRACQLDVLPERLAVVDGDWN